MSQGTIGLFHSRLTALEGMAGTTRLELATSAVTVPEAMIRTMRRNEWKWRVINTLKLIARPAACQW